MPEIHIAVENGVASQTDGTVYICGSGDFTAVFAFGEQWQAEDLKTARFQTESTYQDVLFRGMSCPVPVFTNARKLEVGVFSGNLRTTTPARIALREGIRSAWGPPEDPSPSLYDQLLETLEDTGLRLEEVRDGAVLTVFFRGGEQRAFLRHSEVYVGSGPMPEGYRVQVDPTGEKPQLLVRASDGSIVQIPAIQGPRGEKGEKGDKGDPGPQGRCGCGCCPQRCGAASGCVRGCLTEGGARRGFAHLRRGHARRNRYGRQRTHGPENTLRCGRRCDQGLCGRKAEDLHGDRRHRLDRFRALHPDGGGKRHSGIGHAPCDAGV